MFRLIAVSFSVLCACAHAVEYSDQSVTMSREEWQNMADALDQLAKDSYQAEKSAASAKDLELRIKDLEIELETLKHGSCI